MNTRDVKHKPTAILSADANGCGCPMGDDKVSMKYKLYFELKGGMACESL